MKLKLIGTKQACVLNFSNFSLQFLCDLLVLKEIKIPFRWMIDSKYIIKVEVSGNDKS